MKKLFLMLICISLCLTALSSCELFLHEHTSGEWKYDDAVHWRESYCSLEICDFDIKEEAHYDNDGNSVCDACGYAMPKHEHSIEWHSSETTHWYTYTCGCESLDIAEAHIDDDGNLICDVCNYTFPKHEHTYKDYRDEFGHGWSYTCGCMTPPNFAQHADGDGDGACDECGYIMPEDEAPEIGNEVGYTCPDAELALLGGEGVVRVSELRGKVLVINFWGTWCPYCLIELPHFDSVATEYKDSVTVLTVHTSSSYGAEDPIAYIEANFKDSDMIFAVDEAVPGDPYTDVYYASLISGSSYPVTVILDADGVITYKRVGAMTKEQLIAAIEEAKA